MRLPILAGRLRGKRWLPASGGKLGRVLLGSYEPEQTARFEQCLAPGDTVLDIGAHVGYYTVLSSVLVGPRGSVFAFEPSPTNAAFLRRHVSINGCSNVEVIESAVSDGEGTAFFRYGSGSGTGHIASEGSIEIRTLRIDDFVARRKITPAALKIDVEGAEMAVLTGARETLQRDRPVIFLSTHGADLHRACLAFVRGLGYQLEPIPGADIERAPEVLCVHPEREKLPEPAIRSEAL